MQVNKLKDFRDYFSLSLVCNCRLVTILLNRFKQKPPLPWSAIMMSSGVLVIVFLVGHILHAALNRIAKVEDDYMAMRELKVRAEAADVAKSQVPFLFLI